MLGLGFRWLTCPNVEFLNKNRAYHFRLPNDLVDIIKRVTLQTTGKRVDSNETELTCYAVECRDVDGVVRAAVEGGFMEGESIEISWEPGKNVLTVRVWNDAPSDVQRYGQGRTFFSGK